MAPVKPSVATALLQWATNALFSGGPEPGTATKSEPAAGRKADGWRKKDLPPAQEWNWLWHYAMTWIKFLEDRATIALTDLGILRADTVGSDQIVDLNVTTDKINDVAITRSKVLEVGNNILNPNFRKGRHFWWDAGAASDYDSGDPDVGFTEPFFPGILFFSDGQATVIRGPHFKLDATATGGWKGILSERIAIAEIEEIAMSAIVAVSGRSAGSGFIVINCYDVSNNFLSQICIMPFATDQGFGMSEETETTPANTTYCRIMIYGDAAFNATNFIVTNLQLESGATASPYADDMSIGQGVSVRYTKDSNQVILDTATDTIDFNKKNNVDSAGNLLGYDDPGATSSDNAVTTGSSWKFTAKRYMKISVKTRISLESAIYTVGDILTVEIFRTRVGSAQAQYSVISFEQIKVAETFFLVLTGSDSVELFEGDSITISLSPVLGGTPASVTVSGIPVATYITIHEIL